MPYVGRKLESAQEAWYFVSFRCTIAIQRRGLLRQVHAPNRGPLGRVDETFLSRARPASKEVAVIIVHLLVEHRFQLAFCRHHKPVVRAGIVGGDFNQSSSRAEHVLGARLTRGLAMSNADRMEHAPR